VDVYEDDHPEEEPDFDILTQWRLVEDAEVVDPTGKSIGVVLAFIPPDPEDGKPDYIVVEEGLIRRHRYYIPVDQIVGYANDNLTVNVTEAEVKQRGWDKPPAGVDLSVE
jgi:hypothetical protein